MQCNLHPESGHQFTSYSNQSVSINHTEYNVNLFVSNQQITHLACNNLTKLDIETCKNLFAGNIPDIVLIGTVTKMQSHNLPLLLNLQKLNIGYEIMSIQALCRTFNYLAGEERKIAAFIFFEPMSQIID